MGLSIEVGSYSYVLRSGNDAREYFDTDFRSLNQLLMNAGLQEHREPSNLEPEDCFSCGMLGYNGLHYVRRLGSYLASGLPLPAPGPEYSGDYNTEADEKVLASYNLAFEPEQKFSGVRVNEAYHPFSHLIHHGDADGIYLPQRFATIQYFDEPSSCLGLVIGSSFTLLDECMQIANSLDIPDGLDPESDDMHNEIETQGEGDTKWKRYAIETYGCLQLIRACKASIKTGSVILFC